MMSPWLAPAALVLLAQTNGTIAPPSTIALPQWSTYEMTLTATAAYDTPAAVDLTGVFNGPSGLSYEVKGFWDGGPTFRIRFTPTAEGLWTFMTVSDDPGLDGQMGNIEVVKAAPGAHGFVRELAAADAKTWQYDDDTPAARELTAMPILDRLDLAGLRAIDRLVADAGKNGRLAGLVLFNSTDAASMNFTEAQLYDLVQYMTARYGAYPNVVWCLHPPATTSGHDKFWEVAGEMTAALDPYFAPDEDHARVLLDACAPTESRAPRESSATPASRMSPPAAHVVPTAQTGPNPYQTNAVEGIVRQSDKAAGTVLVRAADGVEHLVHVTKDTAVHGAAAASDAAADALDDLRTGSHVIVHYAADGEKKTAVEVDHIGEQGLQMMEAQVIRINRAKNELTVKLADGTKATLRLTERAAAEAGDAAQEAGQVTVYYTNDAGERVVHFFQRIR
jgi:hypothetical protein